MADCLPLSALLSQALVAFTIEFDNEFEHQAPHRTTNHGLTNHGLTNQARQLNQHPLLGLSMALGQSTVNLRQSLEHLTRESPAGWPALFGGLEPYPDGWRASVQARSVAALSDGSAPRRFP